LQRFTGIALIAQLKSGFNLRYNEELM